MLLFIIIILLAILFGIAGAWLVENDSLAEMIGIISIVVSVICAITIIVMIFVAIINNIGTTGLIASNEQRYESLVYQLENDLYDNDNDLGKKELYNQIQSWNEDLANGKQMQRDIWVGMFYPNIYDDFTYIELK